MKFYKQLNKTDCGPTAFLNCLVWAKYPVKARHRFLAKKLCRWEKTKGSRLYFLYEGLKLFKTNIKKPILYKKLSYRVIKKIIKSLDSGNGLIIRYPNKKLGHIIFAFKRNSKIYFVNYSKIKNVTSHQLGTLEKLLYTKEVRCINIFLKRGISRNEKVQ